MQLDFRPGLFSLARVDILFFAALVVGGVNLRTGVLGEASYSYFELVP